MKTARERAEWFLEKHPMSNIPYADKYDLILDLELSFKEHARDQRHLCVEEIQPLGNLRGRLAEEDISVDHARMQVMNTRAPGIT